MTAAPRAELAEAFSRAVGWQPVTWVHVTGGGYTPAERWIVVADDGSRAFAKFGTTELVAAWLRRERRAYAEVDGGFMPRMLGWTDGPVPVLVLEDLTSAHWPPPCMTHGWGSGRLGLLVAPHETRALLTERLVIRADSGASGSFFSSPSAGDVPTPAPFVFGPKLTWSATMAIASCGVAATGCVTRVRCARAVRRAGAPAAGAVTRRGCRGARTGGGAPASA